MLKFFLEEFLKEQVNSEDNFVSKNIALSDSSIGLKIFNQPLIGYARADDSLFK